MLKMPKFLVAALMVAVLAGCGEDDDDVTGPPVADNPRTFTYVPHSSTEAITSVAVRGSLNDWGETAMTKQADGSWNVTIANAAAGEHQFKYFFNGEHWAGNMCADDRWGNPPGGPVSPNLTTCVDDGFGGANGVRVIP